MLVVVLIGGAAAVLPMLVNPEDIKAELSTKVKEETGRDLQIPGEVSFSVFPWLGVKLGTVEFGNAPGFSDAKFASVENVNVRVKIMPLLERRLEMDTVTLHGLSLNLERNQKGRTNWEDLTTRGKGKKAKTSGDDMGEGMAALAIGGLDIQDANLSFKDVRAGQAFAIKKLHMKTGAVRLGEPVEIDLGFNVNSAKPSITGKVIGSVKVDARPDIQQIKLSGLNIEANLQGKTLPGGTAQFSVQADALLDGAQHTMALSQLKLSLLDLEASGAVTLSEMHKAGKISGELSVAEFNPRQLLKALGQPEPDMADDKAMTRLSMKTSLSGNNKAVSLKPLLVKLDETSLTGELRIVDLTRNAVRFALAVDQIDADRYLPPVREDASTPAASPGAAAGKAVQLPMDTLRGLDIDGTFTLGKLKVAKLHISDVALKLNAKKGLIRLNPIAAKLYDGTYGGNIALDARAAKPRLSVNEKLAKVQIGQLLKDLQGQDRLTGTANLNAKLRATGANPEAVKRSLNGNLSFQFLDGAVNGINLGQMIRNAKATILGGKSAAANATQKTDFAEIKGTAVVKNGLVTNPDLSAKSPLLRLTGKGKASLPAETIDYRVTATVVATTKGQGGADLQDLAGVPIPVHVTGTFQDPKYGLDMGALGQALATSKIKNLGAGVLGGASSAGGGLLDGAKKAGGGILGGAKKAGGGILGGAKKAGSGIGGALKGLLNN